MSKKDAVILILGALLAISIAYIIYQNTSITGKAISQDIDKSKEIQTLTMGYQAAIVEIFQKASECNKVPIYIENQTLNLIAIECIKNNP